MRSLVGDAQATSARGGQRVAVPVADALAGTPLVESVARLERAGACLTGDDVPPRPNRWRSQGSTREDADFVVEAGLHAYGPTLEQEDEL